MPGKSHFSALRYSAKRLKTRKVQKGPTFVLPMPHRDFFVQQILPDLLLCDFNKTVQLRAILSQCHRFLTLNPKTLIRLSESSMNCGVDRPASVFVANLLRGFRVWGLGFMVSGLRVWGFGVSGFWVSG